MDPLVYILRELHDMLFQQFDIEDFKKATEVSPNWNENLGKSLAMMKKVKLIFEDRLKIEGQSTKIEKMLDNSKRCYRNVSIAFRSEKCPILDKISIFF